MQYVCLLPFLLHYSLITMHLRNAFLPFLLPFGLPFPSTSKLQGKGQTAILH